MMPRALQIDDVAALGRVWVREKKRYGVSEVGLDP